MTNKSNEWYTPSKYIEAARLVMGSIDLDPASCALANETVKATRYYTQEDNGLAQAWYGNVWLNPPYSSPHSPIGKVGAKQKGPTAFFVAKLVDAFEREGVSQAIACVNADLSRAWFRPLWAYILCFPFSQIQFIRPNLKHEHQFFSTCFVYLGPHEQAFISAFSQFGTIAKRVSPMPASVQQLKMEAA